MEGIEIKELCKNANISLWKVADKYGVTPQYFSVLLRHSFSDEQSKKILSIIEDLKA